MNTACIDYTLIAIILKNWNMIFIAPKGIMCGDRHTYHCNLIYVKSIRSSLHVHSEFKNIDIFW